MIAQIQELLARMGPLPVTDIAQYMGLSNEATLSVLKGAHVFYEPRPGIWDNKRKLA
jgi:hypothetical protein